MKNLPTKEQVKNFVAVWAEKTKLYFNNLWDALLGRTQGFVDDVYATIDGVSQQAFELMQEKAELEKKIEALTKKSAKKTAAVAQKKPVKKTTKKASGK